MFDYRLNECRFQKYSMESESSSIKVDLHVHSEGSYDCKEPVELILEHADDTELDAIAITDHNSIEKSLEAKEKAKNYDITVIPGVEVSTKNGHLLALGVETLPEKGKPFMQTVDRIRNLGGVAVVPHPFQTTRHGVRKSCIDDIDAVEVYNSWLFTGWKNRKAKKFAHEENYPETAGSDAHSITMVGKAYTEINTVFSDKEELEYKEILEAIKNGSNHIYGKRKPLHLSAWDYSKAMARKTAWGMRETLFLPLKIEKMLFKRKK